MSNMFERLGGLIKAEIGARLADDDEHDEDVAEAMGINTTASKLTAFVTGAILAGLAGMLFAVKVGSIFPSSFKLLVSIIILVVVIVGGMGSIPGVIIGAVVLIGILGGPTQPGLLQEFGEFDARTSSWLETPADIRGLGGAIFGDFRYGTVFIYHNGAESYYGARGFRCSLRI